LYTNFPLKGVSAKTKFIIVYSGNSALGDALGANQGMDQGGNQGMDQAGNMDTAMGQAMDGAMDQGGGQAQDFGDKSGTDQGLPGQGEDNAPQNDDVDPSAGMG
jgi:hypothetical protein